jgi:putative PIG3 family NAD(P)H quinone oxidoreductase
MTSIPKTMTAIAVQGGKGPAEALYAIEAPTPEPKAGEILIRVQAAGINRPDILQRKGQYPPPPGASEIMGLEVAGEVVALGDGARRWQVGDAVCALLAGGGYAQYAVVDARHALPIPKGLTVLEAAALPETVFTVFTNVYERGRLTAGETFLVHGATSGIGVTAIGLAKATGARVIATSRGADKAAKALELGADLSIDTSTQDFEAIARADGGVDVILDMVGGDFIAKGLGALKPDGRLVMIAVQGGATAEINLAQLLVNRLTLTASTLRARKPDEKARLARAIEDQIWPLIDAGRFKPLIDRSFPLADAAAAHAYLEGGTHVGKVMLEG